MNNSLFGKLGQHLGHRAANIRSGVLTMGGLGFLTAGAFDYATWAGMVAVGLSLLAFDWVLGGPASKAAVR